MVLLALIAGLSWPAPHAVAQYLQPQVVRMQPGQPLRAEIKHSQSLPPVTPTLRAGAKYDESLFPKSIPGNSWYKIPDWLAGTWEKKYQTNEFYYNYKTGKQYRVHQKQLAEARNFRGFQMDATGGIWEFNRAPYKQKVDEKKTYESLLIKSVIPLELTEDKVVIREVVVRVQVDKKSGRIVNVFQSEDLNTYTPVPGKDGMVNQNFSIKLFDKNGNPLMVQDSVSTQNRVEPFKPRNSYDGKDMKGLFKNFLLSLGRSDIVPGDSR